MGRLFILPFLILALACSDNMPVEPELTFSPELGRVQSGNPDGDDEKMVPFKAKGIVTIVGMEEGCAGIGVA